MKYLITLLTTTLLSCTGLLGWAEPAPKHTPLAALDQVLAIVNNEAITQSELNQALKAAKIQTHAIPAPADTQHLKKVVLNQLIDQKLQLQIAKRNNITASHTETKEAITKLAARNKLTFSQFKQAVLAQGIDWAEYQKRISQQIVISKIQRSALMASINITDTDIQAYRKQYAQKKSQTRYHVIDFLIATPDNPTPQQVAASQLKARQLRRLLPRNVNILMTYQHTDLGKRSLDELPPLFTKALKNLLPKQYSQPITAPNGSHILYLKSVTTHTPTITDNEIRQRLFVQKSQKALQKWLVQLRDSAYIKVYVTF